MSAAPSSTVFARYPAALSLPSADPSGLAVEVMLRFANVRPTRRDARIGALSLTITDPEAAAASPAEVCTGLHACLKRLGSEEGVAQLSGTDTTEATCAEVLAEQCIFPAFLFVTHFDPTVYRASFARSVEPKVASFWEGLAGGYRQHVLRANPYTYKGASLVGVPSGQLSMAHLAKLKEVGEDVEKAFAALEALCAAKCTSPDAFLMGTTTPTYVDALVYAAASCFFHADMGPTAVVLKAHQQRLIDACPRLLKYTERLRQQFFEADSGTYCLKPRAPAEEDAALAMAAAAEQQYRRGRLQTLWWTGLFASVYFVLANADMVVALLETMDSAEEEEALAEGASANAAGAHGPDGGVALREPREL